MRQRLVRWNINSRFLSSKRKTRSKLSSIYRIRFKFVGVQSLLGIICRLFRRGYCFMPYSWNWPTPINESRYESERLWLSNYQRIKYVLASAVLIFIRSSWGNFEILGRLNCKFLSIYFQLRYAIFVVPVRPRHFKTLKKHLKVIKMSVTDGVCRNKR